MPKAHLNGGGQMLHCRVLNCIRTEHGLHVAIIVRATQLPPVKKTSLVWAEIVSRSDEPAGMAKGRCMCQKVAIGERSLPSAVVVVWDIIHNEEDTAALKMVGNGILHRLRSARCLYDVLMLGQDSK